MQYYAVIDTNVIVSAMLKWDSIPGSILELALDGPITPVLNHEILEEYRQVLLRPKFHLTERIVGDLLDNISARAVLQTHTSSCWSCLTQKMWYFMK